MESICFKNVFILIILTLSSIGLNSQALVTLNPYQYYNKLQGNYLYYKLINQPETLSNDQLAYAQINTLRDFYNHAFQKENFYNFKNILKFLNNCNCGEFEQLIEEFDKWYTLNGSETYKAGYSSEYSRAQIGAITSKYYNLNKEPINEYIENWFFKQDFFLQPDGKRYNLQNNQSKFIYNIPYINDVEEYKFNNIRSLVPIKNYIFSSSEINYFINDSLNEQSIFKYTFAGFLKNKTRSEVRRGGKECRCRGCL